MAATSRGKQSSDVAGPVPGVPTAVLVATATTTATTTTTKTAKDAHPRRPTAPTAQATPLVSLASPSLWASVPTAPLAAPTAAPGRSPRAPRRGRGAAPTKAAAAPSAVAAVDFFDLAGHELRAPMTALKGQAQLLQRRLRREEGRERDVADLDKILFQVDRLNHQVGELLDATHLNQRRLTLAPVAFDLGPCVQRIVAECVAGADATVLHFAPTTEPLVGQWDRLRIEAVIRELLFNALKYGGDEIVVRLTREPGQGASGDQARIEVEDHGIGVPAAERRAIFAERVRGSNAEQAGVGLGLYVAREIVRRHHGQIGVRPRGPRGIRGSVFWVTLPLAND